MSEDVAGTADWDRELLLGILLALTKRLGAGFAEEVRDQIAAKADRIAARRNSAGHAEASDLRALLEAPIWRNIGVTTAPPAPASEDHR